MSVAKDGIIWLNGKLVKRDDAKISVLSHSLHYGVAVFEGIRFYKTAKGSAVFRLQEHTERFLNSWKILNMKPTYTMKELMKATCDTIRANKLESGYIRPLMYLGDGGLGVYVSDDYPVETMIAVWDWGAYLGEDALKKGIKVKTSTYNRFHVNTIAIRSKTAGNYVTSVLAKREAKQAGCDEAIFLETDGFVAEGTGENIFLVKADKLITPPTTSVLKGITRDSVIELAKDLKLEIREERFTRDDVYVADEVFFTGTAAEVTPVGIVDNRIIGKGECGPITKKLQTAFFEAAMGKKSKYTKWLTLVK